MTDLTEAEQAENIETLDEVFQDEQPEPEMAEVEVKGDKKEEAEDKPEVESDEAEESEPAPPAEEESQMVPIKALHDVRRKEREAREELKRLKEQYEPQDNDAPDPAEDPEGYKKWVRDNVSKELTNERYEKSIETAKDKYADYDEMETTFRILASKDKSLAEKMHNSPDPAEFAYQTGKAYHANQEKSLEERILAKLQKPEETPEQKRKKAALAVPDINQAASKSNSVPQEKETDDVRGVMGDDSY